MTKTEMEKQLKQLKDHGFAQHRMILDLQQRMNAVLRRINILEKRTRNA